MPVSEEQAAYNVKPISLEQREEIQKVLYDGDMNDTSYHPMGKSAEYIRLLLSSEQALREENERLLTFCKLLTSEEEMHQEGQYETEMSKSRASEQARREKALTFEAANRILEVEFYEARNLRNQAVEVLKRMVGMNRDVKGCGCVDCLEIKSARDFLSSLSQGTEVNHE